MLLSPATKQALGLRAQIEAIHSSSANVDIKSPDIFKATYFQKLMGTLIPGVNEGPRAVVLAFFKDVPRDGRGDDLNELSKALWELCCECRSTVELFHRHAAMVPKDVQKSLDDLGYGQKLKEALELLEADVQRWC